ncbi:MAG: C40 family peptidase [Lachnospiraceae bacterium]|nr:C40 family peptidase [Lachnospiraceae bacterium]
MDKKFDDALRHALAPSDEAEYCLNQKILNRVGEKSVMVEREKRRVSVAIIITALLLCMSSATVYAAWKHLSSSDVAENIQDIKLSEVFLSEQALTINETQSYGDYSVTLLSIVSGEMLSEYPRYKNESIVEDRTYAVVAIENTNGVSIPDTSEDDYGKLEFFASPLIGGYNPAFYNIASMSGNYTDMVQDGILYRLLECDNVEIFADHDLYLCVSEGMFYNTEAYCYDKLTGKISRNEEYEGLNALFDLPVDISKANPEKAAEYIASLGVEPDILVEKLNVELEGAFEVEITEDNKKGAEVAEYALQFVGNPYVWGADSLTEGTDSSGFTMSVYEHFEISLPHNSGGQRALGTKIEAIENAKPGDLIFYETPPHVAIYIGDGMIVHAMPEIGICISEVDFDDILEIRRIME